MKTIWTTLRKLSGAEGGLTMIELLIVISILGVLASIVVGSITGVQSKGKDKAYDEDQSTIQKAVENYYSNMQTYPGMARQNKWPTCDATASTSATSPSGNGVYIDFYFMVAQDLLKKPPASAGSLNNISTTGKANACPVTSNGGTGNYHWWVDYLGNLHSTNSVGVVDKFNGIYP